MVTAATTTTLLPGNVEQACERSERCEQTNVASDRVACLKCNCHVLVSRSNLRQMDMPQNNSKE